MMERIWADQEARGHVARGAGDVEALRDESEEELREIEHLHREGRQAGGSRGG
jgi:hypothetical protein